MKRILTLILAFALSAGIAQTTFAQVEVVKGHDNEPEPKTLFGSGPIRSGGFGALVSKITQIDGKPAFMLGAKGAWIANGQFSLGLAGYGLTSRHTYDDVTFIRDDWYNSKPDTTLREGRLEMGWGGLQIGYINNSNEIFHYTASVTFGAGAAGFTTRLSNDDWNNDWDEWEHSSSPFYAAEPEIGLEVNVVSFMRIEFNAGYRLIWGSEIEKLNDSKLSGATGSIAFKFGKF